MPLFRRGDDGRERSASDREAARLERERRRAEREGRTPPEELRPTDEPAVDPIADEPPADEPPAEEPPADEPPADEARWAPFGDDDAAEEDAAEPPADADPPADAEQDTPEPAAPAEPLADADPPADADPGPDPDPDAPEPAPPSEPFAEGDPSPEPLPAPDRDPSSTQPLEPVGTIHARRTVSLPRPQTDELGHHTDSWDRPIGNVRVSRAEYQAQPGAPGMPPHRKVGVAKGRRRWLRRFLVALLVLALAAVAVFAFMLFQPFHGKGYDAVVVKIPQGAGARDIGDQLASAGVVDSGFFFAVRARVSGDRGRLRAGTYTLKKSMSYKDALAALTEAPKGAPTIDITLPEGPSRRELAPRVTAAGVRGSYVTASERSKYLHPRTYGAPKSTNSLEGFLFPDTYQLRSRTATARQLVDLQVRQFKREFANVNMAHARRRHLSRYDVLIIASMIEREAQVPKDRRLISAVIYNRLQRGMPLGIDATLRYRLNNWTKSLRESELNIDSDYNTRRRIGLPPTPIGNPGLASIQAAADPAKAKYLFYVVKPCGNGAHAFSSTDAQFQKDVAAYNRARDKRGGKDPSRC